MTPEQSWQDLFAQLRAARAALDGGNRSTALECVHAALAIDPDCLAAHVLQERLLEVGPARVRQPETATATTEPAAAPPLERSPSSVIAFDGYARFEQRARRRAIETRVQMMRTALEERRLAEAGTRLAELIDLDPDLPELEDLSLRVAALRSLPTRGARGRWIPAACVFFAIVFGWRITEPRLGGSPGAAVHPAVATSSPTTAAEPAERLAEVTPPVVASTGPEPARDPAVRDEAAGASDRRVDQPSVGESRAPAGDRSPTPPTEPGSVAEIVRPGPAPASITDAPPASPSVVSPARAAPLAPAAPPSDTLTPPPPAPEVPPPPVQALSRPSEAPPPPARPPATQAQPPAIAALAPSAVPASRPAIAIAPAGDAVGAVREETRVEQTLQRYRRAYEGLDARSAQAVYPSIDRSALARAFDGLASQSLTFDACDVRVEAASATATCRGSARYVPKVGSREPHTEPRTWSFTLRKGAGEWEIENARVAR